MTPYLAAAIQGVVAFFVWLVFFNVVMVLFGVNDPLPEQAEAAGRFVAACVLASAVFAFLWAKGVLKDRQARRAREAARAEASPSAAEDPPQAR